MRGASLLRTAAAYYVKPILWFGLGSMLSAGQAFVILSAIYHAGVCR